MCEPITATAAASAAAGSAAAATAATAATATAATASAATAATTFGIANTTWSTLGSIASLVGSGMSALNAREQGKAAQDAANYNARMGEINAMDVINRAAIEQEKQRRKVSQLRSTQDVNAAASGVVVGTGSAGDIAEQTVVLGKEDELTLRNNAARQAWGYRAQAGLDYMQGAAANRKGQLDAAGTLLTAGARTMGAKWWKDLA
jgi:hypothetical protein